MACGEAAHDTMPATTAAGFGGETRRPLELQENSGRVTTWFGLKVGKAGIQVCKLHPGGLRRVSRLLGPVLPPLHHKTLNGAKDSPFGMGRVGAPYEILAPKAPKGISRI